MNTPQELTQDYLLTHDLRAATGVMYLSATRALLRHFGQTVTVDSIDNRSVLAWRKKLLDRGLSKQSWNTYSNHLRTVWGFALEQGTLTCTSTNPFRKTAVIPPRRPSKTVDREAIQRAREWLKSMVAEEHSTHKRSQITPAWFWLAVFEMFYYTGIRLNALLSLRYQDIDWAKGLIRVQADTEKTHREFAIPICPGLAPHLRRLLDSANNIGMKPKDQLFNVNRFSIHYRAVVMNTDQVEGMYRKLIAKFGVRMTPHRFRHTIATDLMRHPERNIHITKSLLNHSNIATTLGYIETDYELMRAVLHERSVSQGAITFERRVDEQMPPAPAVISPPTPEAQPPALLIEQTPELCEDKDVGCIVAETRQLQHQPATGSKLLTQVERLPSERYSLDQAILPVGTGLSHELSWDGPGTWWQDLNLPAPCNRDDGSEPSTLFALMITRGCIKNYDWG